MNGTESDGAMIGRNTDDNHETTMPLVVRRERRSPIWQGR